MEDREFTSNGNSEAHPHISSSSRPRGDSPPAQSRMTRDTPPGRIYVGNLPNSADRKTVEDLFSKYGRIVDISVKRTISGTSFAFVEYQDPRDAQDAIRDRDGADVDGSLLRVETPFATRGPPLNRNGGGFNNARGPFPPRGGPSVGGRRGEFRLSVVGLPTSGSWQDLKDHMREAGECVFADVYRDGTGVVEFARADDMEYALRHFQDSKFRSHEGETGHITLTRDESRGFPGGAGGGGYRDDRAPRTTHRYSSAPYPSNGGGQYGGRPGGNYGGGGDRYGDGPSSRGGYAPYRGGGGPPSGGGYPDARGGGGDRGSYGPSKGGRRSPSYSRRSRSRSRSFQRYR